MSKSPLSDETKLEIMKQVEYYLGDENLKKDAFFHNLISLNLKGYLDLKYILKCNKIKKKGWTKDDLIQGIKLSTFLELDEKEEKVRRKNNLKLPELSLLNQKRKKEEKKETKKEEQKENEYKKKKIEEEQKKFDKKNIIILKLTSGEDTASIYWKKIFEEFKKLNPELNIDYGRYKDHQGHIGIKLGEGQNLENIKFTNQLKIDNRTFNVQKCEGEELVNFWKEHGSHYEYCLKQREKHNKTKENRKKQEKKYFDKKIILGGKEFNNIDLIKKESKRILNKYQNGQKLENDDNNFMLDLVKYHNNYDEKIKNMDYICADQHQNFKYSRCFYIVDKSGNKVDFSIKKCIENIKDKLKEKENEK